MSSYKAYYESQAGGSYHVFRGGVQSGGGVGYGYPVFRGGIQTGAGLGDILRGLFRAIVPVAKQGIASLAKAALPALASGAPIGQTLKSSIAPALSGMAKAAAPVVSNLMATTLPNLIDAKLAPKAVAVLEEESPQKGNGTLFRGKDGVPQGRLVYHYKSDARKRKSTMKDRKSSAKHLRFNFD